MPVGHTGRVRCFLQRFGAGRACGKDRKILMADIVFLLLFQVVLIGLNAVFASAEIAVLSVNEARLAQLEEQGNKKARRLAKLTKDQVREIATIKMPDLNAASVEAAMSMVAGTARSMGITVED